MLRTSVLVFSGGKCLGIGEVKHQAPLYVFIAYTATGSTDRFLLVLGEHYAANFCVGV